jgi:GT2 family glycosyltransferase
VAAGRNRLAAMATAEVLVFIDDDAIFLTPEAPGRIRGAFADDPRLGVIAARVSRRDGRIASYEFPFRGRVREPERARPCAYFVGAAFAVRRSTFLAVGGFDESYFYSTEEADLSLTLVREGWHLEYDPDWHVEHRPSDRGRGRAAAIPALRMRNRIMMARKLLPGPVAVVHTTFWLMRTFGEAIAARGVREWAAAVKTGVRLPVSRHALTWTQLRTVHRLGGRAWW